MRFPNAVSLPQKDLASISLTITPSDFAKLSLSVKSRPSLKVSPRVCENAELTYRNHPTALLAELGELIIPTKISSPKGNGLTMAADSTPGVEMSFSETCRQ